MTTGQPTKARVIRKAPEPMAEGDVMEYGATVEMGPPNEKVWIKFSSSTVVRPGETTDQAKGRLCEFVETTLGQKMKEWVG